MSNRCTSEGLSGVIHVLLLWLRLITVSGVVYNINLDVRCDCSLIPPGTWVLKENLNILRANNKSQSGQRLSEGILSPELRIVARYCCNQHWGLSGNVKRQIFFHRTATSSSISQRHRPRSSKPLTPNQNRARCNTSGIFGERSKGNQPKQ
ncbi:hypothetical protein J6590_094779 [Homalodisca vitripennis]|nr:hypothetical protein J6590_094779 [Homalodisca vitripennis]